MGGDGDRLRVLLVITRLELGGAQRVVLHTAAELDRRRFAVALAWGPGDILDEEARQIADLERQPRACRDSIHQTLFERVLNCRLTESEIETDHHQDGRGDQAPQNPD